MEQNWMDGYSGAITICNRDGIIVYMNDVSVKQFARHGGKKLIGSNLLDCHPEPARSKLAEMLRQPVENAYTIEKNGVKKIILQSPWMENGEMKGLVEISHEVPNPMPNFIRE